MSKRESRTFSREFKLGAVRRIEAGENVSALARELEIKRAILYRWRDDYRLGGPEALRLRGRPSKAEAPKLSAARLAAGRANDLAEARWQIEQLRRKVGQQQLEMDFFKRALRQIEASRRPSERAGATASSPSSRR
ncbi:MULTISPECIES: transposase [unclassified Inquilinus]|uniref:transposase n=1 Tax=unclassified Inquilinus TaxID=2645927 RepID=UPI003F8DA35A